MKRLVFFGTKHYEPRNALQGIREALEATIDEVVPSIVLEEWSIIKPESLANSVAKSRSITWENIGTPPTPEFRTHDASRSIDFPGPGKLREYGPLDVQEKREAAMCENIRRVISAHEIALVVIGLGHLHSMLMKLRKDFDVTGYSFGDEFL